MVVGSSSDPLPLQEGFPGAHRTYLNAILAPVVETLANDGPLDPV